MKILIFSEYYYPERFLINEITEELVKRGDRVTVVTGKPNYNFNDGNVPKEYRDISYEKINGVEVYRCNVIGRGKNKLRLLLNYASYATNATRIIDKLDDDYDIVYCYQLTPITQLKPAIEYSKKYDKRLICYCLDLAPLSGERILKHFHLAKAVYKKKARAYYQACDKVLVTSKSFINYLVDINGVCREKIEYLPQHAPDFFYEEEKKENRQVVNFMFAGNMGKGAQLENVLLAVNKMREDGEKNFLIRFVGEGVDKDRLLKLTHELELDEYVQFEQGIPINEMKFKYNSADALIVTLRKGQITIPGKLQAYMSTGKPIIGAMDGSGKELILESNCGLCTNAEDYQALAESMKFFLKDRMNHIVMGKNGREYYLNNFTLSRHIEGLKVIFDELCCSQN